MFKINSNCSSTLARTGIINTDHGSIETPFFMPIATYGAVKTQSSKEIKKLPSKILLSNSYHLYIRPGTEILETAGGLHKFMNWDRLILTDSGGFQVFSLQGMRKISDNGVTFQSHLDGSSHYFTPESVVDIQRSIGSDFMMMLDVCPPGDADKSVWIDALQKTTKWAKQALIHYNQTEPKYGHNQIIIPIIQGGTDPELRKQSANELLELDTDAYAIGGLAVGEPKNQMLDITELVTQFIPNNKPRYLMGVGTPADLVRCVARGVDMFDCVIPTRNGRNGQLFTYDGKINIRNAKFKNDHSPIDNSGLCSLSNQYSKSYLHHLYKTEEILGYRIASQHNLTFYINLMKNIRESINNDNFHTFANSFLQKYENQNL